jgi:hypothetical protein
VLVLDEAGQVISRGMAEGYTGNGSTTYAPQGAHSAELARALGTSRQIGRSVLAYEADGESCRVMAVIGGDDVLGSTALFHRTELDDTAVRTFERSSSVIGIVLLSQERMEATKSRGASTLLRSLVSPRQDEPALMANQAERHGVDLAQPLALMLIEMDGPGAGYAARRFRALTPLANVLVDEIDGVLVVLCSATRAIDVRQTISNWARVESGTVHRGVVSRPVAAPAEIPALYATLQARTAGAAPDRRERPGRRPERAGALFDLVRDPRPGQPERVSRGNDRRADLARPQADLGARDHAADLLRQQPEREGHGAAPADPRQHGAPAARDDRGPARPLGQRLASRSRSTSRCACGAWARRPSERAGQPARPPSPASRRQPQHRGRGAKRDAGQHQQQRVEANALDHRPSSQTASELMPSETASRMPATRERMLSST